MSRRSVLGVLILAATAGCAGTHAAPPPEVVRSPLVYIYQRPLGVSDPDWAACDLEADQRAWRDYEASQAAAAMGAFGGLGSLFVAAPVSLGTAVAVTAGTAGVVALNETLLQDIPVVKRRAVRERLTDINDYYATRAHRCLVAKGYRELPKPAPVPRHDYSRCSATTLSEC